MSHNGNEEFWFRFGSLSEPQVHALKGLCGSVEVRPKRNVAGRFVASFRLDPARSYDWLPSFVRDGGFSGSEYGVFVSLVTGYDSEIVEVPAFVLDLHRQVGGKLEFSFTVVQIEPNQSS
jgi:hypothetical protein